MTRTRFSRRAAAAGALLLLAITVWALGRAGTGPVSPGATGNLGTTAAVPSSGTVPPSTGTGLPSAGTVCRVLRVVDGDTFVAEVEGTRERVRLIGIDTPELARDGGAVTGEPGGDAAKARRAERAEGRTVILVRDVSDRDAYDRLLRYVYLEDGTFINQILAQEGWADVKRYPPDTARQSELEQAEADAKSSGLGIWSGH